MLIDYSFSSVYILKALHNPKIYHEGGAFRQALPLTNISGIFSAIYQRPAGRDSALPPAPLDRGTCGFPH